MEEQKRECFVHNCSAQVFAFLATVKSSRMNGTVLLRITVPQTSWRCQKVLIEAVRAEGVSSAGKYCSELRMMKD